MNDNPSNEELGKTLRDLAVNAGSTVLEHSMKQSVGIALRLGALGTTLCMGLDGTGKCVLDNSDVRALCMVISGDIPENDLVALKQHIEGLMQDLSAGKATIIRKKPADDNSD